VSISQYNTKDVSLSGGFTVDTATVNLIAHPENTVVNTAKAVEKGSLIAYSIGEGAVKAVDVGVDKGLGIEGTLEAVVNARKDVLTVVAIAENRALREGIDKALEKDAASLEGAVNEVSELVQKSDGVEDGKISHVNLYQGSETDNLTNQYAACYDENTNETYLNTEGTDISRGGDIMKSIFWEAQRKDNTTNGLDLDYDQQTALASSRGSQAENLWNRFSETANTTSNAIGASYWNSNNATLSTLIHGTTMAQENKNANDRDVVVPRIISKNSENNEVIENYINKYAKGEYKFNDKNELEKVSNDKIGILGVINNIFGGNESSTYSKRLDEAIDSDKDIIIDVNQYKYYKTTDGGSIKVDVDDAWGGGVTYSPGGSDSSKAIIISGHPYDSSNPEIERKIYDDRGNYLFIKPEDTLMHELVGHAIPELLGGGTGNAVKNENIIRKEADQKIRGDEPWHVE